MAPDDHSGGARPAGPVVLRIKLRYEDVETMISRFASNVGKSGLFLPTKTMQPVGTEVKFELRLATDTAVLVGLGRVKHARPPDPARPKAAFGLGIELMRVSREGRELILKMLERRRALGLADVAIPVPDDTRAADPGSQPRAETSGIVREAMREFASAPVAEQILASAASGAVSGPIGVATSVASSVPIGVATSVATSVPEVTHAEPALHHASVAASAHAPAESTPHADSAVTPAESTAHADSAVTPAESTAHADCAVTPAEPTAHAAAVDELSTVTPPGPEPSAVTPQRPEPSAIAEPELRAAHTAHAASVDEARTEPTADPIAAARASVDAPRPLPPMPAGRSRSARPNPSDLLAKANMLATRLDRVDMPELDSSIDVERAVSRARAIAGGHLDGELAQIRESAAAPLEITIEAASAELARQLGGKPIARRDRSAKFDAPLTAVAPVAMDVPLARPPAVTPTVTPSPALTPPAVDAPPPAVTPPAVDAPPPNGHVEAVRVESSGPTSGVPGHSDPHDVTAAIALEPLGLPTAAPRMSTLDARDAARPVAADAAPVAGVGAGAVAVAVAVAVAGAAADADAVAADAAAADVAAADDDDPAREFVRDDKTRVPSGDDYELVLPPSLFARQAAESADDLEIPVEGPPSGGFASISEDQLRTTPGVQLEDDGGARRGYESSPSLQLDENDLEPIDDEDIDQGESTHIGSFAAYPAPDEAAAARLDRELEDAEAEAEADLREMAAAGLLPPMDEEVGDGDVLAETDAAPDESAVPDVADVPDVSDGPELEDGHHAPQVPELDAQLSAALDAPTADGTAHAGRAFTPDGAFTIDAAPEYPAGYSDEPPSEDFAERLALDDEELDREEARNFPSANPRPGSQRVSVDIALDDIAGDDGRHTEMPADMAGDDDADRAMPPDMADIEDAAAVEADRIDRSVPVDLDDDDPANEFADEGARYSRPSTASDVSFLNAPSETYTFAEPFKAPIGDDDFDEPHGFTQNTPAPPAPRGRSSGGDGTFEQHIRGRAPSLSDDDPVSRALRSFDEPSQPQGRARTDELEDALAELDVDVAPIGIVNPRRDDAPTGSASRPLPGLPPETPPHGTQMAPAPAAGAARTRTGANVIHRAPGGKNVTAPPPIPAAARRSQTTPPAAPLRSAPRASTDDGVLIDFEDDE